MNMDIDERPPLLAVDPGREKCGVAVVTYGRNVLEREIISTADLPMRIAYHVGRYGIDIIVMGDRTGAREVRDSLRKAGFRMEMAFVDEDHSSEMGRRRFLLDNRGTGLNRLLPVGLRSPDRPYDDYVAVILAERYLDGSRSTRIRRSRKIVVGE
ncbi:MAG TPA: pre-16S rRNA-processing nuclease YqgF [Armatimonadota bacterium]|nr:pre-16S rRNA-processing nuclease YqgF [Armatimonadota bacterium]